MIIKDGCDDCGICMDMCPLGAIYEEQLKNQYINNESMDRMNT